MKRLVFFAALALLALFPAHAADPADGVFGMARYAPFAADGFLAARIDDDFIGTLDALLDRFDTLAGDLGLPLPVDASVRSGLIEAFGVESDAEVDEVLAWMGDYIAASVVQPNPDNDASVTVIVPLTDRAAAEPFIVPRIGTLISGPVEMGRFTVYQPATNGYTLFADDVMYVMNNVTPAYLEAVTSGSFPSLADNDIYQRGVAALPVERYDFGAYLGPNAYGGVTPYGAIMNNSSVITGAALLDGEAVVLDVAVVAPGPFVQSLTINPDFARFIPPQMGTGIHGADFAALLRNILMLIEETSGTPAQDQMIEGFATVGLNADTFFSWTKGDYALLARLDIRPILPSLLGVPPNLRALPGALDVVLMIEAVNPAAAQEFAATAAGVLQQVAPMLDNVAISQETINGVAVSVLSMEIDSGGFGTVTFELGIGASDSVFAFGTASAVRAVFSGGTDITQSGEYAGLVRYMLPDATMTWGIDGLTAANLIAAGVIFSGELNVTPTAEYVSAAIDRLSRALRYATFSATVTDDGLALARVSVTLGE